VLDVDGVLTDGLIVVDDHGVESKNFHVRDGAGIALWRKAGKRVAIVSGRRSAAVDYRAADLGIAPVVQGTNEKSTSLHGLIAGLDLEPRQVCYMGDDLPDLPALALAGLAACPLDAAPEVRAVAHYVASRRGGRGAVRELVELILQHQGTWEKLVAPS
jgi:3-deoxy-D-manno-octulosonate 8-phosphate phosphatase (KDO 8-P phosphatase)